MKSPLYWAWLLIVGSLKMERCSSILIVTQGGPAAPITTASLLYYGPQRQTVNGPAIFLNGPELCEVRRPEKVKGKIIYTDRVGSSCDMSVVYDRLDRAGALGLIFLAPYDPPGPTNSRHSGWDRHEFSNREMVVADVYAGSVDLNTWRTTPELALQISPPHDQTYNELMYSPMWLLLLRAVLPAVLWRTFWRAFAILFQLTRPYFSNRLHETEARGEMIRICIMVCSIMAPANLINGVLWATGLYGYYALPIAFYFIFYTGLDGTYLLASVLLTLTLREKLRAIEQSLPERSVLKKNRSLLFSLATIFVGGDIVSGFLVVTGLDDAVGASSFNSGLILLCFLANAVIGFYFVVQATRLGLHLKKYLLQRQETIGTSNEVSSRLSNAVQRTLYVFIVNGFYLCLCFFLKIGVWLELSKGLPSPDLFYFLMGFVFFARARYAFWHVVALSPREVSDPSKQAPWTYRAIRFLFLRNIVSPASEMNSSFYSIGRANFSSSSPTSPAFQTQRIERKRVLARNLKNW